MTQAAERAEPTKARARVEIDPAIAAVIGRADAPRAVPKAPELPARLPGRRGAYWGLRFLVGVLRHGVAHHVESGLESFGEIYRVPFVGNDLVMVWDADEIHAILKNDDRVWSTAMGWDQIMFDGLDARRGNIGVLLTLDFEDHRVARKLVQPAFTLTAIKGYLGMAERRFQIAIDRWTKERRVDFKARIRTLLAEVAGEIFTGIRDPEAIAAVDRALVDFWNGMMVVTRSPLLSPTFRRSRRGLETLLRTFLALVPERRKLGGDDVFSLMCQNEDREGQSDESLVRTLLSIMFGAFDTTSAAMTSMAYLLAKNPAWQERLRDEARSIPPGELDATNMKNLRQLEWAWKETLRLYPVASFIPRRALRDVTVSGRRLRAGTSIGVMIGGIGRHPKWWKAPDRFDPERFSPERAEDKQHPALANPFGAGAHACIGMQLANLEMKVFWHEMLHACRFTLEKDYDARHTQTPMGSVSGDVALRLEPLRS